MTEYTITLKTEMVTFELPNGDKFRMKISPINEILIVKIGEIRDQIFVVPEAGNRITIK